MESRSAHPVVCFGEVLWDILPSGPLPGGAPMNVAYHLKKLGINPAMISRIGEDDYGHRLISILSDSGIDTKYIAVDNQQPTGLVYANANNRNEVVYDIVYPSAWDFIQWDNAFTDLIRESKYFVFGSLSMRNDVSRHTVEKLLEIAYEKVFDINLRPPHYSKELIEQSLNRTSILKMNNAELEIVTEWYGRFKTYEERMQFIQDKFGISLIIVTMGGDGAMVNENGIVYRHTGFAVPVADTIGSGDAFLAGFLSEMLQGSNVLNALTFACAMGAFIATHRGACPQYEKQEVYDQLFHLK